MGYSAYGMNFYVNSTMNIQVLQTLWFSICYVTIGAVGSRLYFGSNNYTGSHQPIIHNVECQGNESHFSQCHMSSSGGSLCQLQEAVLLYCQGTAYDILTNMMCFLYRAK